MHNVIVVTMTRQAGPSDRIHNVVAVTMTGQAGHSDSIHNVIAVTMVAMEVMVKPETVKFRLSQQLTRKMQI